MSSENVIRIPIEIQLDKLDQLKKAKDELRSIGPFDTKSSPGKKTDDEDFQKALQQASADSFEEEIDKATKDPNSKMGINKLLGAVGLTQSQTHNFFNFALNPQGELARLIKSIPVLGTIAAALFGLKEFGDYLEKWMTAPGRPWDLTTRRNLANDPNLGRERRQQQEIRVGFAQTIFTRASGTSTPQYAFNSYQAVRNGEIFKMNIYRARSGYRF